MSTAAANMLEQLDLHRRQLEQLLDFLPDKPEENATSTVAALWLAAAGQPASAQRAMQVALPALAAVQYVQFETLIARRLAGVPLAHLTRRQQFMGVEMLAGPAALVPRKETELLAAAAVELARRRLDELSGCVVVDACTGSGNVALAVAHQLGDVSVYGSDLSEDAVALANDNARHLELGSRVQFFCGDLLAAFESRQFLEGVDVLTCNPPYINSAKVGRMPSEIVDHEPRLAFDGGALGISVLMRLIRDAPRFLRKGGWLAFEVGSGQGKAMIKRLRSNSGYAEVRSALDEAGTVRVVMARR